MDYELEDCEPLYREIFQKEFMFKLPNPSKKYDGTSNSHDRITNNHSAMLLHGVNDDVLC